MRNSHAEQPPPISDDVFRVLSLRLEVQNDVEVVKPVLEELEVMRLSCTLGALTTVNLQDFRHDMLEAREFDDEFARFLRTDVFGLGQQQQRGRTHSSKPSNTSATANTVRVMSLFGQQSEVKRELVRLGCWSSACDAQLRTQDQGIYCARMPSVYYPTTNSGIGNDDDTVGDHDMCTAGDTVAANNDDAMDNCVLVMFAWLDSALFAPQRLRDTAAYILRFLTVLSPHVVCCLSESDVIAVKHVVAGLAAGQPQTRKSYSVAFRVERQETQKDAVRCEYVRDIDLSAAMASVTPQHVTAVSHPSDAALSASVTATNVKMETTTDDDADTNNAVPRLIKGSYPALVATTLAPATTCYEHKRIGFADPAELAQWLAMRAQTATVQATYGSWVVNHSFRERFLAALHATPDRALAQIADVLARSTADAATRSREDVDAFIDEQRELLLRHTPALFSVERLLHRDNDSSTDGGNATAALDACLNKLRNDRDVWSRLDVATWVTLTLPMRLRNHMASFHALFTAGMHAELRGALERIACTKRPADIFADGSAATESSGGVFAMIRGWLRGARRSSGGDSGSGSNVNAQQTTTVSAADDSPEFCIFVAPALDHLKIVWWEAVEMALDATRAVLPTKWAAQTVAALQRTCDEDSQSAIAIAFADCHRAWERNGNDNNDHDAAREPSVRVDVRGRPHALLCDVREAVLVPPTPQLEVWKIDIDDASVSGSSGVRMLGVMSLRASATVLDVFAIQTCAVLVVTTASDGVSVERVHFAAPTPRYANCAPKATTKLVKRFGRRATRCDLLVSARLMAFGSASDDEVVLYKLSDAFTSMEVVRTIRVGVCTSLAPPLADVLLLESGVVFMRDATHAAQCVNVLNQQTSRKTARALVRGSRGSRSDREVEADTADTEVRSSRAFALADGLVVACLSVQTSSDSDGSSSSINAAVGELTAIASEDHRKLPVSVVDARLAPSPTSGLHLASTRGVSVQAFGNTLLVVDPHANCVRVFDVRVAVRSDVFRIRHSGGAARAPNELTQTATGTDATARHCSEHWLWAFYHVFEKFPVAGLLTQGSRASSSGSDSNDMVHAHGSQSCQPQPLQLKIVCPSALTSDDVVFADCRAYFASVMVQLRGLHKPLGDLDLPRDLVGVAYSGMSTKKLAHELASVRAQPLAALLLELVTFVPIQICRAEGNMLTVLTDGQDTSRVDSDDDDMRDATLSSTPSTASRHQLHLQQSAVDIARSMRFGLLSPLLEAWRGRCVVVTSMGKQSTGKSYFLNHLTGSSFAIAGARCTDGAWMTLRVLPTNVLLVVLDFEGLGSFERTEQEDVLLAVLNAAVSMFTVFRIESRLDKHIDELFSKFQRGLALLKRDARLFRGALYMGVKDVNPNDTDGVVDEFVRKFEALVGANKAHNFVTEMYNGRLEINCSPPLGTRGYYDSLAHAQRTIECDLCSADADGGYLTSSSSSTNSVGFASGRAFLDCLRLVLAKIAILDWTALDASHQSLQLADVRARLPGVIRTGCLVPVDRVGDASELPQYLKEHLALRGSEDDSDDIDLDTLCAAHPELAAKWRELDRTLALNSIRDDDIDLMLDVCALGDDDAASMRAVGASMQRLFERFLGSYMHRNAQSEQQQQPLQSHKLSVAHQTAFDDFLLFITRRRRLRVLAWVTARLGGDRLPDDWHTLDAQHVARFQMLFTRCARTCACCQLGCMLPAAHATVTSVPHDCGTSHSCLGRCAYCSELTLTRGNSSSSSGKTPLCAKPAGHEGKCECADGDHTCGAECDLVRATNCELRCVERVGHAGAHRCSVETHRCGMPCSVPRCTGVCVRSIATLHSAHKCAHSTCLAECSMDGCSRVCGVDDHFHGHTALAVAYSVETSSTSSLEPSASMAAAATTAASADTVTDNATGKSGSSADSTATTERVFDAESQTPTIHMCTDAHECQALCAEPGNCSVQVVHKQSSRTFAGARGSFKYTHQEMNGSRKKCAAVLAPGQRSHAGAHSCVAAVSSVAVASRTHRRRDRRRTDMRDDDNVDDDDDRIDDGDDGVGNSDSESDDTDDDDDAMPTMLHFCEARCPCCSYFCCKPVGHVGAHTTSHGNMRNTYFLADTADVDVAERKYRAGESGSAEMCSMYCTKMGRAHVHYLACEQSSAASCVYAGDAGDQRRHCTRTLEPAPPHAVDELLHAQFWQTLGWDDPCTSPDERAAFGKCAYACDAPEHRDAKSFCVLPAWHKPATASTSASAQGSGSSGDDGFAYVGGHKFACSHVAASGKLHHVFVLDCSGSMTGAPWTNLLGAYREYLHNRVSDGASLDIVSAVTFDNYAKIEFEAQNITTVLHASDRVKFRGGGTTYSAGLRTANEVLSRNAFATYKPVLVFFSDGQPCDPAQGEQLATHICSSYSKYGLEAFAVGYGVVNLNVLRRVAELLGGSYHSVLTGMELKRAFYTISTLLGTRAGLALTKPLHESNCPICQRDMAAEVNVTLRPCGHALHRACKKELMKRSGGASSSGSSSSSSSSSAVACPICRKEIVG